MTIVYIVDSLPLNRALPAHIGLSTSYQLPEVLVGVADKDFSSFSNFPRMILVHRFCRHFACDIIGRSSRVVVEDGPDRNAPRGLAIAKRAAIKKGDFCQANTGDDPPSDQGEANWLRTDYATWIGSIGWAGDERYFLGPVVRGGSEVQPVMNSTRRVHDELHDTRKITCRMSAAAAPDRDCPSIVRFLKHDEE